MRVVIENPRGLPAYGYGPLATSWQFEVARSCAVRKSAWHTCARDGHAVKAVLTRRALLVKIKRNLEN
jgi:hypothetical protein